MKRALWTIFGFIILALGVISIVLHNLVYRDLIIMHWMNQFGELISFIIKLSMIILGILIMLLNNTNWQEEEI